MKTIQSMLLDCCGELTLLLHHCSHGMKPNHIFIQLRNLTALRMHNFRFIDSCIRILGTRGSRRYLQQVILENWQRENIKFKKLPSGAIKSSGIQKSTLKVEC
jgi:hypothetical protein